MSSLASRVLLDLLRVSEENQFCLRGLLEFCKTFQGFHNHSHDFLNILLQGFKKSRTLDRAPLDLKAIHKFLDALESSQSPSEQLDGP